MCVGSPTAGTWSSSRWRPDNEFETHRLLDLLVQVSTDMLNISEGQGVLTLTASTLSGTAIRGQDFIRVVP